MRRHRSSTSHHAPSGLLGAIALALAVAIVFTAWLGSAAALAAAPTVSIDPTTTGAYTTADVAGTVDPEGNETYYSFEYSTDGVSWSGFAFETPFAAVLPANAGSTHVTGELTGLTPGTHYFVRLAAVDFVDSFPEGAEVLSAGPNPAFTTGAVALPTITIAAPTSVTGTAAHFSGQISPGAPAGNPAAFDVTWHFQCNPECPGLTEAIIPADSTTHTVEVDASGLDYNTNYEVTLVASNAEGEANASRTFKTQAVAPEAVSRPVGTSSATTAVIGGSVDPRGSATTYWTEYADNPAFGGAVSIPSSRDASAGSGQTPVLVSHLVSGLQPNSTYFFRITAESAVGGNVSAAQSFHTPSVAVQSCPNETLRAEDNSLSLPDCRAYELVTPDANHAALSAARSAPDGETMVYESFDAPAHAHSGQALFNFVRAKRDAATGWSGLGLSPPLVAPVTAFTSFETQAVSADLSSTIEASDQPLSGGTVPNGKNFFLGRPDGSYRLLTIVGLPIQVGLNAYPAVSFDGGTADFSHVYIQPGIPQRSTDPPGEYNTYSWSEEHGLQLLGILPDGTPAPGGATLASGLLQSFSADGRRVLFTSEGKLYLRTDESQTVELGPISFNSGNALVSDQAGVTPDGGRVLFTDRAELTGDANTGESGGVPNEAGKDLYSYDTATGQLTDLTVDTNPADATTGANVGRVVGATSDGSYLYFTATGDLAEGATPGHPSLYLWHNGEITFVAPADGFPPYSVPPFYLTPDGQHVVFVSTESLTGYDNIDPVTGQPHSEIFEATFGSGLVCVSCRANGTPPTADSTLPEGGPLGNVRGISDDGSRVYFQSADAVVPQASNGLQKVFEYSDGKVSLISGVDSTTNAYFFDASASGKDIFFDTYDELVPNPNGGDAAIYDARVEGGFPARSRAGCSGVACEGAQAALPGFEPPGSLSLNIANPAAPASKPAAKPKSKPLTRAQKLTKALKACKSKHNKKKRSACEKKARRTYGRSK